MKHLDALMPDGTPAYLIQSESGKKRWAWRYTADGPELYESTGDVPPYLDSAVKHWWRAMSAVQAAIPEPHKTAVAQYRARVEGMVRLAGKTLPINVKPDVRKEFANQAAELHRLGNAATTPPEIAEVNLLAAAKLHDLLRRWAPAKSTRDEGPTPETKTQQWPPELDRICRECGVSDKGRSVIKEVRAFHALAAQPVAPAAVDWEATGGGMPWNYEHPSLDEAMADLHDYVQWGRTLAEWPWWYNPNFEKAKPNSSLLASYKAAVNVNYWAIVQRLIFDLQAPAAVEEALRIPTGRCKVVLQIALEEYRK